MAPASAPDAEAGHRGQATPPRAGVLPSTGYAIDCRLNYELDGPCDFVYMVHVARHPDQRIAREQLTLTPGVESRLHIDGLGNRVLRLHAPQGPFSLRYEADVERFERPRRTSAREMTIDELPDDVLPHLLPTRYCESDLLGGAALKTFGDVPPGYGRVQAICDWIHEHVEYRVGSTLSTTTSRDVFVQRAGVCRDFAQLGITFCRALNIPARLVCGYVRFEDPPPDFHAVFEAFLDGEWVLFDPTRMAPIESLLRVATGRDAKDVAFATIFGPARMTDIQPDVELWDPKAAAAKSASHPAESQGESAQGKDEQQRLQMA
jgi:transglutaminase-like putative cysteine protease